MKAICLFFALLTFHGVLSFKLPPSDQHSNEFECLQYFLTNLTNFSHQSHITLLQLNGSRQSRLGDIFVATEIGDRSITIQTIDQFESQFDEKSTYIVFISAMEIEHFGNLLKKAKGFLHVIFERADTAEMQVEENIWQTVNYTDNISTDLNLFIHLNFNHKWKLFASAKEWNNLDVFAFHLSIIGECVDNNSLTRKIPASGLIFQVKSPNASPFASFSEENGFHSGIEYSLLKLVSEKFNRSINFEYLNTTMYGDLLHQITHGNLSEIFQKLVDFQVLTNFVEFKMIQIA